MKEISILILSLFVILLTLSSCKSRSRIETERDGDSQEQISNTDDRNDQESERNEDRSIRKGTTVEMENVNGVYMVPITVNGINLKFVFDTGASAISISTAEVAVMYKQGLLTNDDVVGTQQFVDATGSVSEGAIINLKTVTIGDITLHNVKASVVDNIEAPLLLGQTALSKFGKISIDYNNNTIEFN